MSEQSPHVPSTTEVQAHLHTISELLRHGDRLDPEARELLANLVEELGKSLESSAVPSSELARLLESTSHMVQAIHDREEPGVLEAARERVERAVIAAEAEAPGLANIAHRLVEMLSNVGI